MNTTSTNSTLQMLSIAGVSTLWRDDARVVARSTFETVGAAIDRYFENANMHPLVELRTMLRDSRARVVPLLKKHQASLDHILRMSARFDNDSPMPEGTAEVIALQPPFEPDAEMRWIPSGPYQMGSPEHDEYAFDNEKPLQTVMTGGFFMLDHPVTNGEFRAWLKATGRDDLRNIPPQYAMLLAHDDFPAIRVSIEEAIAYAKWRGEQESKRRGVVLIGRIPTREEWEKAAKGPSGEEFRVPATREQAHFNAYQTRRVNDLLAYANAYGLKDMIGNVREWTSSEGKVPSSYIICSTSFDDNIPRFMRAAYHTLYHAQPVGRGHTLGFRIILVPKGS